MHDGAHGLIFKDRKLNDFASQWFCAYPVMTDTIPYRKYHSLHHKYTATDSCGRSFDSTFSIDTIPDIGAEIIFAGKECASDEKAKVVIKIEGAKKPVSWSFQTKILPVTDPVGWIQLQSSATASADVRINPSPLPETGTDNFTITIANVDANKDYRIVFTDANGCLSLIHISEPTRPY